MQADIDISTVCRICLQATQDEMTHLLENDGTYFVYEKIEKCANLKVKVTDDPSMPMNICSKCKTFLSFAFQFYIMCQNSAKYLKEFGLQNEEDVDKNKELLDEELVFEEECEYIEDDQIFLQTTDDQTEQVEHVMDSEEEIVSKQSASARQENEIPLSEKTLDICSNGAAIIRVKNVVETLKDSNFVFVCELCGNVYNKAYLLERHMRRHRNENPYECEICGNKFAYNFQLRRHMNKHTGKRPYICSYCQRSFTDNSTMRKHERLHRNERPFKCDVCGKDFTYSSVLKAHKQTHTGSKPYICGICGKRFSRAHHLRAHLETQLHAMDPQAEMLIKHIRPDDAVKAKE